MTAYRALIRPSGEDAMGGSCILDSHPGRWMPAAVRMPAVVWMPACHSKGERPIGAATGYQSQPPRPCATPPPPRARQPNWLGSRKVYLGVWGALGAPFPTLPPPGRGAPRAGSLFCILHVLHAYSMTKPLALSQSVPVPVPFTVSLQRAGGGHRNTARQATDGLWTEAREQQKQSNDPGNNQHNLNTPTTGRR